MGVQQGISFCRKVKNRGLTMQFADMYRIWRTLCCLMQLYFHPLAVVKNTHLKGESESLNWPPCHVVDDMNLDSRVFINRGCDI